MKKPNLFLVGAPKCGTTSLYHYLKQHPSLFFPEKKEPHFFSKDLEWRYQATEYKSLDDYLRIFEPANGQLWVGEASVWYLYSTDAPREIYEFNPDAKILCILRNPIEMMHSLYRFSYTRGAETVPSFEEALELEPQRQRWDQVPRTLFLLQAVRYREVARFAEQIRRYQSQFSSQNLHVVLFDDLKNDAKKTCDSIFRFLDVDPDDSLNYAPQNITDNIKTDGLTKIRRLAPRLAHRIGNLIPAGMKPKIASVMKQFQPAQPVVKKEMDAKLRTRLCDEFRDEIGEISNLIGRDLSGWLK